MPTVHVFDPAMCCSTGICGPSVDPDLVRFAADLEWLANQGISVERFNLSQNPAAFANDATVAEMLKTKGEEALPLLKVDGAVKSMGTYPSRENLAAWAGIGALAPSIFTDAVTELVAIGAAIASNCEPCFKFHYDNARKLGVSKQDMLRAVTIAQNVKDTPAKAILQLAESTLGLDVKVPRSSLEANDSAEETGSCCSPSTTATAADTKTSSCC